MGRGAENLHENSSVLLMNLLEYCIGLPESACENLLHSFWQLNCGRSGKRNPADSTDELESAANWAVRKLEGPKVGLLHRFIVGMFGIEA